MEHTKTEKVIANSNFVHGRQLKMVLSSSGSIHVVLINLAAQNFRKLLAACSVGIGIQQNATYILQM